MWPDTATRMCYMRVAHYSVRSTHELQAAMNEHRVGQGAEAAHAAAANAGSWRQAGGAAALLLEDSALRCRAGGREATRQSRREIRKDRTECGLRAAERPWADSPLAVQQYGGRAPLPPQQRTAVTAGCNIWLLHSPSKLCCQICQLPTKTKKIHSNTR